MADVSDTKTAARNQSERGYRLCEPETPVTGVASLDELIGLLGLQRLTSFDTTNGCTFIRCNWPEPRDRTVTILKWPDGQWEIALDVNLAPDAPPAIFAEALREMAGIEERVPGK